MDKELQLPQPEELAYVATNDDTTISEDIVNSTNLNQEDVMEDVMNQTDVTAIENSTINPSPRTSITSKNRKKSPSNTTQMQMPSSVGVVDFGSSKVRPKLALPIKETDSVSISASLTSFDSVNSRSSSSSSIKTGPGHKINRIFSMLQKMQQIYPQQWQQQEQLEQRKKSPYQQQPQPTVVSDSINNKQSVSKLASSIRQQQLQPDSNETSISSSADASSNKRLFGLGRSQDSLMSSRTTGSMAKPNQRNRLDSLNSWADSQFSGSTGRAGITEEANSFVHTMPYHKDGWTSLFIVGSSTYAQLLIVICIVAALSEVVTHKVPFIYFEAFFTYLYLSSIAFFTYVFCYLLQSNKKREDKNHKGPFRKSRRLSNMTSCPSSEESDSSKNHTTVRYNTAMSTETEYADSSVGRFIVSGTESQRRRFSRTDSEIINAETSKSAGQNGNLLHEKEGIQWTPPSVKFDLADKTTGETLSYALGKRNSTTSTISSIRRKSKKMKVSDNEHSHGSFFLRAGAVGFALGTMIYDGLEFGAFLEVPSDSPCFVLLRGLNPLLHAAFVFLQMYFIFISARLNIHKFKAIARFGLMHCLATNVCVWVRTLVRESLKEINSYAPYYEMAKAQVKLSAPTASDKILHHIAEAVAVAVSNNEDTSEGVSSSEFLNDTVAGVVDAVAKSVKSKKVMSLWELTGNVSCGHRFVLGDLIMDAAPFLYPFLIEYSLIGAAVIYVTWSHIGVNPKYYQTDDNNQSNLPTSIFGKSRQLRIDCTGAYKGLFIGLIFLTASLLCLVLFFIFIPQPQFHRLGLILADAAQCVLLLVSLCAMAIGAYRVRSLRFHDDYVEELGTILLRISALGMFSYSVFSMIAGALTESSKYEPPFLVFINGFLSALEVTVQTLYISDMSRRSVNTPEHNQEKPGRQCVTFLLITNMTLWLVYTFEMQKVEANPVQLNFYGFLPWAIIQRITLPLCIFYRFHSAIVYSEIWKNSYRYHAHQK